MLNATVTIDTGWRSITTCPVVASAATAILIAHVAGGTRSIRVGSGGIMLPNHAPLIVAEQFGTLETLYPGRIDLGLGRAPGTDRLTSRALRRDLETNAEAFAEDVQELRHFFEAADPGQAVRAIPGAQLKVHFLSWDRACSGHQWQPCSACPLRSHRISRPVL